MMYISVIQLILLTWMLTIVCSGVNVYVSTTSQTWENASHATDCQLAEVIGDLDLNHTRQQHHLAWVRDKKESVWINMMGCFYGTTGALGLPRNISVDVKDPVVYCLQQCNSQQIYLTPMDCYNGGGASKECYCGNSENTRSTSEWLQRNCSIRVSGHNTTTVNNDTKYVCGYNKTNTTTDDSGNCMSTRVSNGKFVNIVQNCNQNLSALCTDCSNQHSSSPDLKHDWKESLHTCKQHSFIGLKNGSLANGLGDGFSLWIGMFRVELPKTMCMAINLTNSQSIKHNCSRPLPSLCINRTTTATSNNINEQTSTPVLTFTSNCSTSVTGHRSNLTVLQTQGLSTVQGTETSSMTSSQRLSTVQGTETSSMTSSQRLSTVQGTETSSVTSSQRLSTVQGIEPSSLTSSHRLSTVQGVKTSSVTSPHRLPTVQGTERFSVTSSPHITTIKQTTTGSNKHTIESTKEFPTLVVGIGAGGAVLLVSVLVVIIVLYRRRKLYRSSKTKRDSLKSTDRNATNTQRISSFTIDNTNENNVGNMILSDLQNNDERENTGEGVYDHLKTHKNRKSSGTAFTNNAYDHVTRNPIKTKTGYDGSVYDSFSKHDEREVSGEDYDHFVPQTDIYDHMRPVTIDIGFEDYDHIGGRLFTDQHNSPYSNYGNLNPK